MVTKIRKWGNSLALRIPKSFAKETQLNENSEVNISYNNNQITIKVINKQYDLNDLLSKINKDNIHNELNSDYPNGNEIW